jgi:hypothetical protein
MFKKNDGISNAFFMNVKKFNVCFNIAESVNIDDMTDIQEKFLVDLMSVKVSLFEGHFS